MKSIYCNCGKLQNKILYICNNQYKFFINKNNVVGLGLGYKITKGFNTFKKCITVYVKRKLPKYKLNYKDLIPKLYNGITTDVVESGIIKPYSLTQRIRPVICGYSVGPSYSTGSGTLGCLVKDHNYYYLLGNNHVFTNYETLPLGTPITQPAIFDKGIVSRDTIGNLSKYIHLEYATATKTPKNYVDCAIARVLSIHLVSLKIEFVGNIKGIVIPTVGDRIQKVGKSTERTFGIVVSIGTTIIVQTPFGAIPFMDQIITSPMSNTGDSGALLLDNSIRAAGLLLGGSSQINVYNSIVLVLDALKVGIVTI